MIVKISDFIEAVDMDMAGLVDSLVHKTGRNTPSERESWNKSLPKLSKVLAIASESEEKFSSVHVCLGHLTLEYKLPSSSSWCDAVLLGDNKNNNPEASAYIVELKDWETREDKIGTREGLITHKGTSWHHPSDQLKGYINYCRRFHSAVLDHQAQVSGSVFFTKKGNLSSYMAEPNQILTKDYPIFSVEHPDELAAHMLSKISKENEKFAKDFECGYYRQDRNILIQVADQLKQTANTSISTPFELLDEQRKGFNIVMELLEKINTLNDNSKYVVIVEGPPGSGKSALAVNLWIEAVLRFIKPNNLKRKNTIDRKAEVNLTDNIVFVTTSSSQKTNWQNTFTNLSKEYSAKGFILPANQFNPGITTQWVSKWSKGNGKMPVASWEKNIEIYTDSGGKLKSLDNHHFLSIVDEAHALINTEGHNIGFSSGWVLQAGPQAFHIIRSSKIAVFFTDSKQSYRDNETTTTENIEDFAKRLEATVCKVSLDGHQFRAGGSKEYVCFIDNLFNNNYQEKLDTSWRVKNGNNDGSFIFEMVDHPHQLDEKLKEHLENGAKVRLVSSYSRPWKTKKNPDPHSLNPQEKDFYFKYFYDGKSWEYSKIWNYAPKEDYTLFIQAPKGSKMHANPLSEVGCPYVVRGFDYDYIGLFWLEDLVYREPNWVVRPIFVEETSLKQTKKQAKKAEEKRLKTGERQLSQEEITLLNRIIIGYRILLTRSLKGLYLYVSDQKTKEFLTYILEK